MLFEEAKRCGIKKLALTEINNTASYLEMLRLCDENRALGIYDLELAAGIEFRNDQSITFIAIAKNNDGFEKLNRFLSAHQHQQKRFPERAPAWNDAFVIYPFGKVAHETLLPNEFIGVKPDQLANYDRLTLNATERQRFVYLHPVTFLPPNTNAQGKVVHRDFNLHRLLRAIDSNVLLSKLPAHFQAMPYEYMQEESTVLKRLAAHTELIANTKQILSDCSITCDPKQDKNKKYFTASHQEDLQLLRSETLKGYGVRYGTDIRVWNERVEKELSVIDKKGFTSYYLITYDLVSFARSRGFDFVGRGSGANSTVAYCLGITNVDPIELDLYFERFLNEERSSPPDFDIDFSWDQRDAVYEYLFSKYGSEHVCLLGTHVTFQYRSVVRELGKVFGLPKSEIETLADSSEIKDPDHITRLILSYGDEISKRDLPSNLSIHAGGVLITEESIYHYTATDLPPKGLPVSHFEMHNAEDFGIHKFDILSQRGLGHIKETVKLVKQNQNQEIDISRFGEFKRDERVKNLLREGRTMGCFYVESPAMRMLLAKLRCGDYLTLVAASSIIRPGVASSGMMRAYIERFHAVRTGKSYEAIHPLMDELLKETYGVMVYQEDVIRVAHFFAGLSLTEADVLRRGMSGKYRSRREFQLVRKKFFENCIARGYDSKVIDRVWFEIESFSGYSFAKGHSASYAVESYQSLFLKAHFPLEFMVGVINNFGGFYQTEFYFHEARMNGGMIEPPCINRSGYLTNIKGNQIFTGFVHMKGLEEKLAKRIVEQRIQHGNYIGLDHFLQRHPQIGLEQLRLLIRIGAFRFTGKSKQRLLWEAMLYYSKARVQANTNADLFTTEPKTYPLPTLERAPLEDAFDEMELLGFPLCDPFLLLGEQTNVGVMAREMQYHRNEAITMNGYLVTIKQTRTSKGESMQFATFLDASGNVFDTVHFPNVAQQFPFRGRGFYALSGKVVDDFGVFMLEVTAMKKLSMLHRRPEKVFQETRF